MKKLRDDPICQICNYVRMWGERYKSISVSSKPNWAKERPAVQKQRPVPSRKEAHHRGRELDSAAIWPPSSARATPWKARTQAEIHTQEEHTAAGLSVGRGRYRWLHLHLTYSLYIIFEDTMKDKLQKRKCICGAVSLQIQQRSLTQGE